MTATPENAEEDYYMDESFDDDGTLSDVEEEAETEELEDSGSASDSDVEAEFLRGNVSATVDELRSELTIKHISLGQSTKPTSLHLLSPPQPHARRQQIFGKVSGGANGFSRQNLMKYESSSSEDESQVVITRTVAEVNQSKVIDDETLSDRTLVPSSNGYLTELEITDVENTEVEDNEIEDNEIEDTEVQDEMGEEEEEEEEDVVYDNEENADEDQDEDVQLAQLKEQNQKHVVDEANGKQKYQNQGLVDVEDCGSETDDYLSEQEEEELHELSPHSTDNEMDFIPVEHPEKKQSFSRRFPNLQKTPVLPEAFENIYGDLPPPLNLASDALESEIGLDAQDCDEMSPVNSFNVKFLEKQMTQMSEMIMKTFRLSGGAQNNIAFEQLAQATKMIKQHGKKQLQIEEQESESISVVDMPSKQTSPRSDKVSNGKCRCPSSTDIPGLSEESQDSLLMEECGQGDGLRYSQSDQPLSDRIDCRVSSVTPTSFNSDNCGYHFDIRRPRSSTSSEKVK